MLYPFFNHIHFTFCRLVLPLSLLSILTPKKGKVKEILYIECSSGDVQFYGMVVKQEDREEWANKQPGGHKQSLVECFRPPHSGKDT